MAISPRLEQNLKTVQQLVLSPQMQQAIQILQMPIMELRLKIAEEMSANPLLEEAIDSRENIDSTINSMEKREETTEADDTDFKDQFDRLSKIDEEWRNHFKQTNSIRKHTSQDEEKRRFMETSVSVAESLYEHLMNQMHLLSLDDESKTIAKYIIGSIEDNGYFSYPLNQVAESLQTTEENVTRVLSKIQKFTPLGVGAKDLKECLFLQLNASVKHNNKTIRNIIEHHLQDLAKNRFPQIAKSLKTSVEDVKDAHEFISKLEPKPGRAFGKDATSYISPDIFIEEKEGIFEVMLNDDRIPHLHISNLYKRIMNSKESQDETKNYIKNKVRSGMWLIKNIQQRQQTIYNIMKKIVELQITFFKKGVGNLTPMTMQDVAEPLKIHESTVSRAISKKHVQTPHGLFPIKYFFSVKMKNFDGSSTSSRNIKQKLLNIIENEDSKNPLSDQDIITILKQEGIKLARRTVAKYRGELKIPSSTYRRKY